VDDRIEGPWVERQGGAAAEEKGRTLLNVVAVSTLKAVAEGRQGKIAENDMAAGRAGQVEAGPAPSRSDVEEAHTRSEGKTIRQNIDLMEGGVSVDPPVGNAEDLPFHGQVRLCHGLGVPGGEAFDDLPLLPGHDCDCFRR
jgi:hypothetical protein